jgi:hypothetical protein
MPLAIYIEVMDLRMKDVLHLRCRAAEGDPIAAAGDLHNVEALGLQPDGQFPHVISA